MQGKLAMFLYACTERTFTLSKENLMGPSAVDFVYREGINATTDEEVSTSSSPSGGLRHFAVCEHQRTRLDFKKQTRL